MYYLASSPILFVRLSFNNLVQNLAATTAVQENSLPQFYKESKMVQEMIVLLNRCMKPPTVKITKMQDL